MHHDFDGYFYRKKCVLYTGKYGTLSLLKRIVKALVLYLIYGNNSLSTKWHQITFISVKSQFKYRRCSVAFSNLDIHPPLLSPSPPSPPPSNFLVSSNLIFLRFKVVGCRNHSKPTHSQHSKTLR